MKECVLEWHLGGQGTGGALADGIEHPGRIPVSGEENIPSHVLFRGGERKCADRP
ncbi:hypothetical protein SAMN02745219_01884 [Desulfofundulus thermosubterraneus DSM 16057]|uniref:Uncharacterized protein n=1 Tax=Desulfofundulus thermosubterraneus DSM 16057 TaxID=1121432 RepID=A0A1M6H156_9FIRM|nr:hypothetical protein SAMN02745219_01884 [Desulfofundulus thermosubterraneus DSM 16057]